MELVVPWPEAAYVAQGAQLLPRAGGEPIALPPGAAPSPDGRRVVWVAADGVRVAPVGGPPAAPVALPPAPSAEARWLVAFFDAERVYLHATDAQGEVDACWLLTLRTGAWSAPRACLAHDFHAVDAIQRGPGTWWVVHSHAEGVPAVTVQRYDGTRARVAPVPWDDLFPFGAVHASFVGDEVWWTSDCDLAAQRPCAFRASGEAAEPTRWRTFRWRPASPTVTPVEGDVAPGSAWVVGADGVPVAVAPVRVTVDP